MISVQETTLGPLRQPWKRGIAVGRAYELLRADLLEHLAYLQREIGYEYCRFHALFHDDMGVVTRDADGHLRFHWHHVDKVYDALLRLACARLWNSIRCLRRSLRASKRCSSIA